MTNLTRIKNNQITDATITNVKIASGTLTGTLFNPDLTLNSNVTINGNLTVTTGNVTAVQSTTTQVSDPLITLGQGNGGTSYDLGLILVRGSGGNRFIGWKENLSEFVFINTTELGSTSGNIATSSYSNVRLNSLTATGDASITGNVSATAVSATSTTLTGTLTAATVNAATIGNLGAAFTGASISAATIGNAGAALTGATLITTSTINVGGTATVNALVSNTSIIGGTTLNIGGTATVNALTSNGNVAGTNINGTTGNFTGNVTSGNLSTTLVSATNGSFSNNLSVAGTLSVNVNVTSTSSGIFYGNAATGLGAIYAGIPTGYTVLPNVVAQFTANINNYAQLNFQNINTGSSASGDIVITADDGTDTNNYIDLGINSSTFNDANYGAFAPHDGYLIMDGGNLLLVAEDAGSTITFLAGNGYGTNAVVGKFSNLGLSVTATTASTTNTNGALIVAGGAGIAGAINGGSTLNIVGTATVNALTSNGAVTGTTGTFTTSTTTSALNAGTINANSTATVNSLTSNGAIAGGTTLNIAGTATVNALTSNGNVSGTNFTGTTGTFTGNVVVGNLSVQGTTTTVNSVTTQVVDPIFELATGPNGAALSTSVAYDAGIKTHYYDTADRTAFFGRTNDTGYFEYYSNVTSKSGNVISGTYGTIKTGNYVATGTITAQGALTVNAAATVASLTSNGAISGTTGTFTGAVIGTSTANFGGTATVNALTSNGAVSGTTGTFTTSVTTSALNSGAINSNANITGANITSNGATVTSTLSVSSTSAFTGNITSGNITSTGTLVGATINAATIGNTGAAFTGASISAATIGNTGAAHTGATLTVTSTINAGGTATVNALTSNGAVSGTTGTFTGNVATANLAVTGIATISGALTGSSTATFTSGVQNTPIGNATANTGAFTTLTASGATTFTSSTDSSDTSTGAVIVSGGLAVQKQLNVTTTANLGNVSVSNVTISSRTANVGLNLNGNGTGGVTVNSGNATQNFKVNGSSANVLVVDGSTNTVNINTATPVTGAILNINSTESILIPVGLRSERPASPTVGMFRYNTTDTQIEYYTGPTDGWQAPGATEFTVIVSNIQQGDGSSVNFTLPANSTTAGTLISINGIIQQPTTSYGVSGSTVTFTEAPLSTDTIDFRIITTSTSVSSVGDGTGYTRIQYDQVANDNVTRFYTNQVESINFDSTGNVVLLQNQAITANASSTTVGTSATTVDSFATGDVRAAKYVFVARNSGSTQWTTVEALVVHDGTTASITPYGITNTGATTQITLSATISGGLVLVQATGAAAGTVVNKQKIYVVGS